MKNRYQIDQQRAVQEFRQLAREENPHLQMIFPMTEVFGLLQEGVGHLMREAGLALMSLVMEEEVRHLAGERHEQLPSRRAGHQSCLLGLSTLPLGCFRRAATRE
jgi:hypothetical protein